MGVLVPQEQAGQEPEDLSRNLTCRNVLCRGVACTCVGCNRRRSGFQDEESTLQLLKGHLVLEQTVETYAETVGMLSQQRQRLLELGHPER